MRKLVFETNIDRPTRVQKVIDGLEFMRGKYSRFSIDIVSKNHMFTIETTELEHADIIDMMRKIGLFCKPI